MIFLFPRWDMLIPWRVTTTFHGSWSWRFQEKNIFLLVDFQPNTWSWDGPCVKGACPWKIWWRFYPPHRTSGQCCTTSLTTQILFVRQDCLLNKQCTKIADGMFKSIKLTWTHCKKTSTYPFVAPVYKGNPFIFSRKQWLPFRVFPSNFVGGRFGVGRLVCAETQKKSRAKIRPGTLTTT